MSILRAPGKWAFTFEKLDFKNIKELAIELRYPILQTESARLLYFLCSLKKPKDILELGTGLGYSTRYMAAALNSGNFYLCDFNEKHLKSVARDLSLFNCHLLPGPVNESLKTLAEDVRFDLIFLDIDKRDYLEAFELSWPRLRSGGLMIVDNIYFSGQVFEKNPKKKEGVGNIRQLLELAEKWSSCLFPCGDGLLGIIKPDH